MTAAYKLIRSRRRSLALIVNPDTTLTIRAPLHLALRDIERFLAAKADWIASKQAEARTRHLPTLRKFVPGELFYVFGNLHPLEIDNAARGLVFDNAFRLAPPSLPRARELIQRWYQKQARRLIPARIEAFARQFGLEYTKIRITSARTRWGSCTSRNVLSFSWRLVMAPPIIMDYVILHELAHTVEHNHSPRFWARVAAMMPDYEHHRKWLKLHGQHLDLDRLPHGELPPH